MLYLFTYNFSKTAVQHLHYLLRICYCTCFCLWLIFFLIIRRDISSFCIYEVPHCVFVLFFVFLTYLSFSIFFLLLLVLFCIKLILLCIILCFPWKNIFHCIKKHIILSEIFMPWVIHLLLYDLLTQTDLQAYAVLR